MSENSFQNELKKNLALDLHQMGIEVTPDDAGKIMDVAVERMINGVLEGPRLYLKGDDSAANWKTETEYKFTPFKSSYAIRKADGSLTPCGRSSSFLMSGLHAEHQQISVNPSQIVLGLAIGIVVAEVVYMLVRLFS